MKIKFEKSGKSNKVIVIVVIVIVIAPVPSEATNKLHAVEKSCYCHRSYFLPSVQKTYVKKYT